MKNFLSSALGAFVGAFVALFLASVVMTVLSVIMMISSITALNTGNTKSVSIDDNSVLLIDLQGSYPDHGTPEMNFMSMMDNTTQDSFETLVDGLNQAEADSRIKGVVIKADGMSCGAAKAYEIREAIADFKKFSGKWIYAYADQYSQGEYYIASIADSIFVNPQGSISMLGLNSVIPYFKKLMDRIGVKMEVFKVGTFKSAVEPYMLEHISDANTLQTKQFLGSIWNTISSQIAASRGIDVAQINECVENVMALEKADYLIEKKFVDNQLYEFQFEDLIKSKMGIDDDDDVNYVSLSDLAPLAKINGKGNIGIIYAQGEINSGADGECIDYVEINKYLLDAAKDDDIKGVVMRVNSPGGSAFDSEQMWAAIQEFKKTGKPFAVSMGDYAASGGYYISCSADRIFAEPTTLTGSIGIFGMLPNASALAQNVGVNFETISTHDAGIPTVFTGITPQFREGFQRNVNQGYELFTKRCSDGRNMPIDSLKAIAEGRVWTGEDALRIGLVDEIGNLDDAVEWVAAEAGCGDGYYAVTIGEEDEDYFKFFRRYISRNIPFMSVGMSTEAEMVLRERNRVVKMLENSPLQARMLDTYVW